MQVGPGFVVSDEPQTPESPSIPKDTILEREMINSCMVQKARELIVCLIDKYLPTNENKLVVLGAHDILISAFGGHQSDSETGEPQLQNSRCHTLLTTNREAMDKLLRICCRADGHNLAQALHLLKKIIYRCHYGMLRRFEEYLFDQKLQDIIYCCVMTVK